MKVPAVLSVAGSLVAVLALAGAAVAQTPLGVLRNVPFALVTRGVGAQILNPTVNFTRFDADRYAAFGVDPARPGVRRSSASGASWRTSRVRLPIRSRSP